MSQLAEIMLICYTATIESESSSAEPASATGDGRHPRLRQAGLALDQETINVADTTEGRA